MANDTRDLHKLAGGAGIEGTHGRTYESAGGAGMEGTKFRRLQQSSSYERAGPASSDGALVEYDEDDEDASHQRLRYSLNFDSCIYI